MTQAATSALGSDDNDLVLLGFGLIYKAAGNDVKERQNLDTTLLGMALKRLGSTAPDSELRREMLDTIGAVDLRGIRNNPAWCAMILQSLKSVGAGAAAYDNDGKMKDVVSKLTAVVEAQESK